MWRAIIIGIFTGFFLGITPFSGAQKVGVVLSGGGAKGIAHIGVLKALEENHIPIHFIAGTSIGAIVGGLYASGYSPDEIAEIFKSEWFRRMAKGKMDETQLFYFKKRTENAAWLELKFRSDSIFSPELPSNFIQTHQMDLSFLEFFGPPIAAAGYSFDKLFIPFRCVATDVFRDQTVVFRNGDLSRAIRASMTIPFYFSPVTYNDTLLFDGGMQNNFPVDVMITDFNPDYIIGVKVASSSKLPRDEDILSQIYSMLMVKQDYSVPENRGILIEPDVTGAGELDFNKFTQLYNNGYQACQASMDAIQKIIPPTADSIALTNKRKEFRKSLPPIQFNRISIQGLNSTQKEYALQSIYHQSGLLQFADFRRAYYRLIADEMIGSMYPSAHFDSTSSCFDLHLLVKREKNLQVQFGGNISSNSVNQAFIGVNWRHLSNRSYFMNANSYFGRFYSSFQVSGRADFPSFSIPATGLRSPYFIETKLTYNRWDFYKSSSQLFFEDLRPAYLIKNEFNLQALVGIPVENNGRVLLGGALAEAVDEYYQTGVFSKRDTADLSRFDHFVVSAGIEKNSLNFKQFPNKGRLFSFKMRWVWGSEKFQQGSVSPTPEMATSSRHSHAWFHYSLHHQQYIRCNPWLSAGTYFEGQVSNMDFFSNYTGTILNAIAFSPTSQSKSFFLENYRSFSFSSAGVISIFHLSEKIDFRLEGYFYQPYRKILQNSKNQPFFGRPFNDRHFLASANLVIHTPVAPISFSLSWYDKSSEKFIFMFNFGYSLFNSRAGD